MTTRRKTATPSFFYNLRAIYAEALREGAGVDEVPLGYFSNWKLTMNAIDRHFASRSEINGNITKLGKSQPVLLGLLVEEVIVDSTWFWSTLLPLNYHRTRLLNQNKTVERATPGIVELTEHGTLKTPMTYKLGDIVCFNERGVLRAGIICGKPRHTHPKALQDLFAKVGYDDIDITDEYLWYSVQPFPSRPYEDVQLIQTNIFPHRIALSHPRQRALERFRSRILGEPQKKAEAT
jgi:hypothetical protein